MDADITHVKGIGFIIPFQDACDVAAHKVTKGPGEVVVLVYFVCHLLKRNIASVVREDAYVITSAPQVTLRNQHYRYAP